MIHEPHNPLVVSLETTMTQRPQSFFQFVALLENKNISAVLI